LVKYCLDTHTLVWYFGHALTLSSSAYDILEKIFQGEAIGIVPTLVILEAFYVSLKDKKFIFPEFVKWVSQENILIVPFDEQVLLQCFMLSKNLDIHDRVIVATAIQMDSILISKDRKIHSIADLRVIW
jgi:predicted nucleic acid-binding protein